MSTNRSFGPAAMLPGTVIYNRSGVPVRVVNWVAATPDAAFGVVEVDGTLEPYGAKLFLTSNAGLRQVIRARTEHFVDTLALSRWHLSLAHAPSDILIDPDGQFLGHLARMAPGHSLYELLK